MHIMDRILFYLSNRVVKYCQTYDLNCINTFFPRFTNLGIIVIQKSCGKFRYFNDFKGCYKQKRAGIVGSAVIVEQQSLPEGITVLVRHHSACAELLRDRSAQFPRPTFLAHWTKLLAIAYWTKIIAKSLLISRQLLIRVIMCGNRAVCDSLKFICIYISPSCAFKCHKIFSVQCLLCVYQP